MTLPETLEKLKQMRLMSLANSLEKRLREAACADLSHEEFVALIVDEEWVERENRKLKRRVQSAKFKVEALLPDIDYQTVRGVNKTKILELSSFRWIQSRQNLLLIGPTGIGKSFIAQALGHLACQKGHSVLYIRFTQILNDLYLARADGSYGKQLLKLVKPDLLILDDWGIASLKSNEAQDLLELIEQRHELKSTIITTQLPVDHWHEFIQNETIADAILDRLVHNAHKIEMKGESMRKLRTEKKENPNKNLDPN